MRISTLVFVMLSVTLNARPGRKLEDHRHDFVVIVAGYTEKMEDFISSNPGLRSRFNKFLLFEDYTPEQLVEIFKGFCARASFKLTPAAEQRLLDLLKL